MWYQDVYHNSRQRPALNEPRPPDGLVTQPAERVGSGSDLSRYQVWRTLEELLQELRVHALLSGVREHIRCTSRVHPPVCDPHYLHLPTGAVCTLESMRSPLRDRPRHSRKFQIFA